MTQFYRHEPFCFAGQTAPCGGYFEKDSLPCVCGMTGTVLEALSQQEMPIIPLEGLAPDPPMRQPMTLQLTA